MCLSLEFSSQLMFGALDESNEIIMASDASKKSISSPGGTFGMEKMKQKDAEERLKRMDTKQRRGSPTRDAGLQTKVFYWIMELLDEQPRGKQDYDMWISDGVALGKVLQSVMFNSIPLEMIQNPYPKDASTNSKKKTISVAETAEIEKAAGDRIKTLLKYLLKYGVPEQYLFEINDLKDMTNIPKVTRCIAMVGKMSGSEKFKHCTIEVPSEVENGNGCNNNYNEDLGTN